MKTKETFPCPVCGAARIRTFSTGSVVPVVEHECPLHQAAPALLAALKNATGLLSAYAGHVQDGVTDLALVEAKAAIRAAEGKP